MPKRNCLLGQPKVNELCCAHIYVLLERHLMCRTMSGVTNWSFKICSEKELPQLQTVGSAVKYSDSSLDGGISASLWELHIYMPRWQQMTAECLVFTLRSLKLPCITLYLLQPTVCVLFPRVSLIHGSLADLIAQFHVFSPKQFLCCKYFCLVVSAALNA